MGVNNFNVMICAADAGPAQKCYSIYNEFEKERKLILR